MCVRREGEGGVVHTLHLGHVGDKEEGNKEVKAALRQLDSHLYQHHYCQVSKI